MLNFQEKEVIGYNGVFFFSVSFIFFLYFPDAVFSAGKVYFQQLRFNCGTRYE